MIDTFLETWHIGTLHRQTASIFQPNINVFDAFGYNGRFQYYSCRSILELRTSPNLNGISETFGDHLSAISEYPDRLARRPCRDLAIVPEGLSTEQCIAEAALYSPEPATTEKARKHWDKNMELLPATVEHEDFPVCIDIQRGFRSNAQSYITFGRNERAGLDALSPRDAIASGLEGSAGHCWDSRQKPRFCAHSARHPGSVGGANVALRLASRTAAAEPSAAAAKCSARGFARRAILL